MAKVNAVDKLPEADRHRLEADISASDLSWRDLQAKYGIAQATLRSWSDRNGVVRNPSGLKRALVERALARPEPLPDGGQSAQSAQSAQPAAHRAGSAEVGKPTARDDVERAADEDVRDMRVGLQAARMALSTIASKLQKTVTQAGPGGVKIAPSWDPEPRDLKVLSEAVAINIGTIRLIRGLDVAFTPEDMKKMSDEQLRKIAAGQSPR